MRPRHIHRVASARAGRGRCEDRSVARPHPLLLDLAAARVPADPTPADPDALVASAIDHRMTGLLWSAIASRYVQLPPEHERALAERDVAVELHHERVWKAIGIIGTRLESRGVAVAVVKGVTAETRWYDRPAERPSRDIDVLVEPDARHRIADIIDALDPEQAHRAQLPELVREGVLQSVDLSFAGIAVDVHVDLLKVEIPTRHRDRIWSRTVQLAAPDGGRVRALDPEVSLVHFLLHANKDRFARLIAYADVARILRSGGLDWEFVEEFAAAEGLQVPVFCSLYAITDELGLSAPPVARPRGWRASAWHGLWPRPSRLHGTHGLMTRQHRQFALPLLAEGRRLEAIRWLLRRRVFPPRSTVPIYYPDTRGPYPLRIVVGRVLRARDRRRGARLYR